MATGRWEHFSHDADMGVRGIGATPEEAFEQAALALTGVITDPDTVQGKTTLTVTCDAPDLELLLADWLNALIYEMDTRDLLFSGFEVSIKGNKLEARVMGEAADRERHQPAVEVKGATFTELRVAQEPSGQWIAQCVVDV